MPQGEAKNNSFNLFHKLKLFHLHNACTLSPSLLDSFLIFFSCTLSCSIFFVFDSDALTFSPKKINFAQYFFCEGAGLTETSRVLLSQFLPRALCDPLSPENKTLNRRTPLSLSFSVCPLCAFVSLFPVVLVCWCLNISGLSCDWTGICHNA